jgi:hypothetical protein
MKEKSSVKVDTVFANVSDWIGFFNTRYQKMWDWIALATQSQGIGLN